MTRAGLLLAVVGYYGLHWLAGVELLTATRAADAGPVVIWQFAKMAGYFLQYLVPLLCVVGYAGGAAFLGLLFHVSELSWCEGDGGLMAGWLVGAFGENLGRPWRNARALLGGAGSGCRSGGAGAWAW